MQLGTAVKREQPGRTLGSSIENPKSPSFPVSCSSRRMFGLDYVKKECKVHEEKCIVCTSTTSIIRYSITDDFIS